MRKEPVISGSFSRRSMTTLTAGLLLGCAADLKAAEDEPKADSPKVPDGPTEAAFERDYPAPSFKPLWKKPQISRLLVQDFVNYAHSELDMTKTLLEKEPMLINAVMDWGGGDWESGLGGASHMGRKDIVAFLLEKGARIDIFCAAMMGMLDALKAFLTLEPKLIDARGPHGFFNLHVHAQMGGKDAEGVLEYLQSIKKIELKTLPFQPKSADPSEKKPE